MTGTDQSRRRIELYVRSLFPTGAYQQQEQVIDRLERLDESGHIAGFSVIVWGKRIATETAAAQSEEGRYILNRIAEFKQWALSQNSSLESFYQTQTVDSEMSEASYRTLTLPVMGLAEYIDGELVHVAPCTEGDTVRLVEDRLTALESTPSSTASLPDEWEPYENAETIEGDADD